MKRIAGRGTWCRSGASRIRLFLRYRRDLNAARARLAAVERHVISTQWGAVEYAERGCGDPCSSCMGSSTTASADSFPSATSFRPSSHRSVSIRLSRSSMPPNATPAAQADAFAALLDALGFARSTSSASQPVRHRRCNWPCVIPRR
jgi:hypothetical protein